MSILKWIGRVSVGVETCDLPAGESGPGIAPCERLQACDEQTHECIDPDPRAAWQSGPSTEYFTPAGGNCPNLPALDDIKVRPGAGRELISHSFEMGVLSCNRISGRSEQVI